VDAACGFAVPKRARTRHWKRPPSAKPESENRGEVGVTVRPGCHTPVITAAPVGVFVASTGVRSIW
jgi:hypothetical protein